MFDYTGIRTAIAGLPAEKRGDAFERVVAHFLRHDPTVDLVRVWRWADWPRRIDLALGRDLGVDLVAEDADGRLVAIQAKYHGDPRRYLGWEEVSTFLAYRPDLFIRRIVVTTAADRSANAKRATEARTDATWILLSDLVASPVDWTGALDAASGMTVPERTIAMPRPYQVEAVDDVVRALETAERVQLVMACGTGKTLVTRWVVEARDDRLVLVLVPTLLLLKQLRREWRTHAREPFADLVVCSDSDTVGRDEWIVRADELGAPVTTDPVEIATFLGGPGRRVVFGTYASSARIAEAQSDPAVPAFDSVIADEAHRVAGIVATGAIADRDHRVVLDASRLRATRRVFTTATPRVYGAATRGRFEDREDVEIASMDDPERFGAVAHQLWFRRAVELGVLVDYQLVVVVVTDAEVAKLVHERDALMVDGRIYDAETLASLVALRSAITDLGLTRSISFHHTIARSRDFAAALDGLVLGDDPPSAAHISGAMPVDDRDRVLARLRDPDRATVVTNARCLTEGIDVPSLDAVAFIDPRSSAVDIVQAVGRVMRRAPGKERGHVIVPVFLRATDLEDPEAAIESTAFAPVLAVLRALRAHDPDLVSDATRITTSLGRRDAAVGGHIADHLVLLGRAVDPLLFREALELRLVEVSADRWEVGLGHLRTYVSREGHARVPSDHLEGTFPLGRWVNARRATYARDQLSVVRVRALEQMLGWTWDVIADQWAAGLAALKRYAEREGHARVPDDHAEDGLRLGNWVRHRRRQWRRGMLELDRVRELEAVIGWTWNPHLDDWHTGLQALRHFASREGHARVVHHQVEGDVRLGQWVVHQRYLRRAGRLEPARAKLLAEVAGWQWDVAGTDWERGLVALDAFIAHEGHALVPRPWVEQGFKLGTWIHSRRREYKLGQLDPESIRLLERLPGWSWEPRGDQWARGFAGLRTFVEREGHCRVPPRHQEGAVALGSWVTSRRSEHRTGRLPGDRVEALERLPGWSWEPPDIDWEEGLAALRSFVRREGHARVKASHTEDAFPLGFWVNRRRVEHKRARLSSVRGSELEAFPGWTWDPRQDAWKVGMAAMRTFVAREGHGMVPIHHVEGGYRLGRWVFAQRRNKRTGRLSPERSAALDAVGMVWSPRDDDWATAYEALRTFIAREGHARVPKGWVEGGVKLGTWVAGNRRNHRNSPDRASVLDALPGWSWDPHEDEWGAAIAALRKFIEREGHARVPGRYREDGFALGAWVGNRRFEHRSGRLAPERASRLETVSGWTWDASRVASDRQG